MNGLDKEVPSLRYLKLFSCFVPRISTVHFLGIRELTLPEGKYCLHMVSDPGLKGHNLRPASAMYGVRG